MSRPIVYVGPSLSRHEAAEVLPDAELRGPIRRWDLYRDREKGGAVFLILDGVFFQQEAIAPREILDVLADGARVFGASSMGALRAAECWPAGMIGVGAIYRFFRRGRLLSDDEVALTFSPDDGYRPLSVPLINVRYAVAKAVRQRWLSPDLARRVVQAAEETFYPERDWTALLGRAGADRPADLAARLAGFDLKKMDALRALRRVAAAADAGYRPPGAGQFKPRDATREPEPDTLGGLDPEELRRDLANWLLLSGRAARHLLAVAAAHPGLKLDERLRRKADIGSVIAELRNAPSGSGIGAAAVLQMALFEIWSELPSADGVAEQLWSELTLSGQLDAEILRFRTVREAAAIARRLGLKTRSRDRHLAEVEIAGAHGFRSWADLRAAVRHTQWSWPSFVECRDELALAKRLRENLFNPPPFRR